LAGETIGVGYDARGAEDALAGFTGERYRGVGNRGHLLGPRVVLKHEKVGGCIKCRSAIPIIPRI
jgi:hypothetical protein